MKKILVTGAGGFIGHHLVEYLKGKGYWVRGVDVKAPEFRDSAADDFRLLDLRRWANCLEATEGIDEVYNLAADMGGMGFITTHNAQILHNNTLISTHMIEASRINRVKRYLYTSSACIYPLYKQLDADVTALKESDAYPAQPEDAYGWEKLITEHLCHHYHSDFGLETRTVRLHNIYGPYGTYFGGREKAPAALCRKVALAEDGGEVEIWGDGEQTRSFCYVDDCVKGLYNLMQSDHREPINLGTEELIKINDLALLIAKIAGKNITIKHIKGPQGVRGRNSDNHILRQVLDWEPDTALAQGLIPTYNWINEQIQAGNHLKEERPRGKFKQEIQSTNPQYMPFN